MTLDLFGQLGLGTTAPAYQLHVEDINNTAIYAYSEERFSSAIHGESVEGKGVFGEHKHFTRSNPAVYGLNSGWGDGVMGKANNSVSAGVYGISEPNTGNGYGVRGTTNSSTGYAGYFQGGRNYFEGNVGIGTTSPNYPIHIYTDSKSRGIFIDNDYDGSTSKMGIYSYLNADGTGTRYGNYNYVYANPTDNSPSYGSYVYTNANNSPGHAYGVYAAVSSSGTGNHYAVYGSASGGWAGYFPTGNTYIWNLRVGATTGAAGYKVSVDGKIMCEELRVALSSNWPDYVFEKDYELMPLIELEKSIIKNKHLPGIPSASNIKENGIMVGDMTEILTKKVEELTLYIIELNKKVEKLEKENKMLMGK